MEHDVYVAPMLAKVGDFSVDTLGWFGSWFDVFLWYPAS